MEYKSKFKAEKIDELLDKVNQGGNGGGVPIVSSEEERDALNLPVGSLVSVVKEGTETSLRNLYQPQTVDDIIIEKLSPITSLKFKLPHKDYYPEFAAFDCIAKDFSLDNMNNGPALSFSATDGNVMYIANGNQELWSILIKNENNEVIGINHETVTRVNNLLASAEWYYVGQALWDTFLSESEFDELDKWVKVGDEAVCQTYRKIFNGYAIVNQPDIYTSESEASGSTVLGGLAVVNSETMSFKLASELALVPNAPLRSVHYMWPDKLDLSSASGTVSVAVGSQAENLVIVFGCALASKTVIFSINDTDYELATFNESGSVSHNYENIGIVTEYFNNRTTDMQFLHGTGYNLIDQLFQIGVIENQTNLYVKGKDAFKKVVYEDALSLAITKGFKPNYPNGDKNDNPLYGVIAPANEYTYVNVNKASSFSVVLGSIQRPDFVAEYVIEFDITASADISFPSTITWANGVSPTFEKDTKVVVSILNNLAVFAVFPK